MRSSTDRGRRLDRSLVSVGLIALIAANVAAVIIDPSHGPMSRIGPGAAFEVVSILTFTAEYALRVWSAVEDDHGRYRRPIIAGCATRHPPRWPTDGDPPTVLSGRAAPVRPALHARLPPVRGVQAHAISAVDAVAGERAARGSQAGRGRAVRPRAAADRRLQPGLHGRERRLSPRRSAPSRRPCSGRSPR